jgi:hypothetical protein
MTDVQLDAGQFDAIVVGIGLIVFLLAAILVGSWGRRD